MEPEFNTLNATAGVEIIDPIETRRFAVRTATPVDPTPTSTEGFVFPVDTACEIQTEEITLAHTVAVTVREDDGTYLESVSPTKTSEFPAGNYLIEFDPPIKLYFRANTSMTVTANTDTVKFDFGGETVIRIGARSYHSSPAETITVPDDPDALMEAVSAFPSALKTTSPERSWPTLRGHPPRIERGECLTIPSGLDAPDTGIAIEIPPKYEYVYAITPLAYYLSANVFPGETARVTTNTGSAHKLGADAAACGETAGELLKRNLILDCIVRTEGYYSMDLHERDVLESRVDLDFAELYEAPLVDRFETYLSLPDETVESVVPTWHRVTHVQPTPGTVEVLPYIVNDLSVVHSQASEETWSPTTSDQATEEAIESFVRKPNANSKDGFTRSATTRYVGSRADRKEDEEIGRGVPGIGEYVPLPEVDALEQAYVGNKTPEHGAKLLPEAFENDMPEVTEGVINITVVCNDKKMREEWDTVSEIYGNREDLYVDVDCRFDVSTDELRKLLAENNDVFHFIGHIDGFGFQCSDGVLDAETIEETDATILLLNGCRSHDQGIALIEAGANAAVVSLGDVGNEGAVEVGEMLARLLYYGFSVGSTMNIVRNHTSIGSDYNIVGNPNTEVAQCEPGMPVVYHLEGIPENKSHIEIKPVMYPTRIHSIGSVMEFYFPNYNRRHIAVGECGRHSVKMSDLYQELATHPQPLVIDGNLIWSDYLFSI